MRRETRAERAAWTSYIEGTPAQQPNKYGAVREEKYASGRESRIAGELAALERMGNIRELKEQVSFTLVEGQGRIRPIKYIADFVYRDRDGTQHICDAKGYTKNPVYRLKKKLMKLLHGLEIEEL